MPENIKDINSKISHYPDFIHIDIVDKTMKRDAADVEIFRFETIKDIGLIPRYKLI